MKRWPFRKKNWCQDNPSGYNAPERPDPNPDPDPQGLILADPGPALYPGPDGAASTFPVDVSAWPSKFLPYCRSICIIPDRKEPTGCAFDKFNIHLILLSHLRIACPVPRYAQVPVAKCANPLNRKSLHKEHKTACHPPTHQSCLN